MSGRPDPISAVRGLLDIASNERADRILRSIPCPLGTAENPCPESFDPNVGQSRFVWRFARHAARKHADALAVMLQSGSSNRPAEEILKPTDTVSVVTGSPVVVAHPRGTRDAP